MSGREPVAEGDEEMDAIHVGERLAVSVGEGIWLASGANALPFVDVEVGLGMWAHVSRGESSFIGGVCPFG